MYVLISELGEEVINVDFKLSFNELNKLGDLYVLLIEEGGKNLNGEDKFKNAIRDEIAIFVLRIWYAVALAEQISSSSFMGDQKISIMYKYNFFG